MSTADYNRLFVPTYNRSGAPMVKGSGVKIYDSENNEYLDFGSGIAVNALGHCHPLLHEALLHQASELVHASNLYFTEAQIVFAEKLIKHSFADKVFLCNSGTEANEAAIKFARKWAKKISPQKFHVLSFSEGFHGRTYGALGATSQSKFHMGFEPMPQGFHYCPFNDFESAKKILDSEEFAAVIVEPLQGEGGINCATTVFLRQLREYTHKHSIALIFDEIQCGIGRTGTLWHYEQHNVIPDIMTVAKPLGGGLPLGATLCTEEISSAITPGDHGTTFGGNPLACALGTQILDTISDPVFLRRVKINGAWLKEKLVDVARKYDIIESVRGEGFLLGVRFKDNPQHIVQQCRDKGLLLINANLNTVRFLPPLIVTQEEINSAVGIFERVLSSL
ncbi:aspartate aminotransferase family protein [Chitinispirillales bacterium ANBcel5]|uniref:aspartate aminotransferase family protein n=1 Tax=Cellulosispirillum alkaliphilum TaxID=3039283 RepID=UPI002A4E8054|nr:aspartate aminotransferase family protein [Chitinispirillales bacterium ANBcel5]